MPENKNNAQVESSLFKADDFDKEKDAADKAEKQDQQTSGISATKPNDEVLKEQKETD